jgi:hypothetical protein
MEYESREELSDRLTNAGNQEFLNEMEGYRVPTLEEFVQDFEFEIAVDTGIYIPDKAGKLNFYPNPRAWEPMKVYWMNDPKKIITEQCGDYTVHTTGAAKNFFMPFDVAVMIERKLVRVKK